MTKFEGSDIYYRHPSHLTKWELLAWTIAWEGCISVSKYKDKRDGRVYLNPFICITNTRRRLLEFLFDLIEVGKIFDGVKAKGNRKQSYELRIWKHDDLRFVLNRIVDLLPAKEGQARLMLEFLSLRSRNVRYSSKAFKIADAIREMNRKGIDEVLEGRDLG